VINHRLGGACALISLAAALVAPGAQAKPPEIRVGGFAAFDYHQYLLNMPDAVRATTMLRLAPRVRAKYKFVRAAAEVELRHDFGDAGRGNRIILREATIGLRHKGFRLEGGALQERWGKMDTGSPTDNFMVPDYEELFFPEPLPVPGVVIGYARGPVAVKGVFVPAFRPARFRHAAPSRWDMTRFLPTSQQVPLPPPAGDYDVPLVYAEFLDGHSSAPNEAIGAGFEGGFRVDLILPSADVGFSVATVHDRLPTWTDFQATNDLAGFFLGSDGGLEEINAQLQIDPQHTRLVVPGFDVAVTAGPFVIRGEVAGFLTEDMTHQTCLIDDPYVKYAAGVELMLQNVVGNFDLAVRAQYNGDVEIRKDGDDVLNADEDCTIISFDPAERDDPIATDYESGSTAVGAIRHPYKHAAYWNVNLGFTDEFSLDLRGFVGLNGANTLLGGDVRTPSVLFTGKLSYVILDRFVVSGGWMVIRGAEGTLFAPYGDNHRVELGFRYNF
jgi:hypothetical protein